MGDIFQKNRFGLEKNIMVTVTKTRVSADLSIAKVYLSIFPSGKSDETLQYIRQSGKDIRFELGKKIRHQLKEVPELEFYIDDSLDYIEKIENIIDKSKK